MKIKQQQVGELESQASHLKQLDPDQEQTIVAKKQHVEERYYYTTFSFLDKILVTVVRFYMRGVHGISKHVQMSLVVFASLLFLLIWLWP